VTGNVGSDSSLEPAIRLESGVAEGPYGSPWRRSLRGSVYQPCPRGSGWGWSGSPAPDTISGAKRWFCWRFGGAVTNLVTSNGINAS